MKKEIKEDKDINKGKEEKDLEKQIDDFTTKAFEGSPEIAELGKGIIMALHDESFEERYLEENELTWDFENKSIKDNLNELLTRFYSKKTPNQRYKYLYNDIHDFILKILESYNKRSIRPIRRQIKCYTCYSDELGKCSDIKNEDERFDALNDFFGNLQGIIESETRTRLSKKYRKLITKIIEDL